MFITWLLFVTNLLTSEPIYLLDFLLTHHPFFFILRVVNLVTQQFPLIFTTWTLFYRWLVTAHTVFIMTFLHTLMFSAWQEPFAESIACWDILSAALTLTTDKLLYCVVARWAILHSTRIVRTRLTLTFMTYFLAIMKATVKLLITNFSARMLRSATNILNSVIATETRFSF